MSKVTVELPESLQRRIAALALADGFTVEQFVALAVTEKLAALRTLDYLRNEAAHARREDFDRFLAAVPKREPIDSDRLPE